MRTRVFLAVILALAMNVPGRADGKKLKLEVKFRRPGAGIGGGAYTGPVFAKEDDARINTCAIVKAVGALPAGFTQIPATGLDPKSPYKTDYYRLETEVLSDYNRRNPSLRLAAGPLYGVVYEVSYEVKKNLILFQVRSRLYMSGRDSAQWYEYSKKCDDTYFSRKLVDEIGRQFGECAKSK